MRICPTHWDKLKAACSARGMDHLVHQDGEAAMESQLRVIEGTDTKNDFNPLLNANWAVTSRALQYVGLSVMEATPADSPEFCPICIAIKYFGDTYRSSDPRYPDMETHWIDGVMDAQLEGARNQGLMPPPC